MSRMTMLPVSISALRSWKADEELICTGEIATSFIDLPDVPFSFASIAHDHHSTPDVAPVQPKESMTPRQRAKSSERGQLRTISPPEGLAMSDCVLWYIGEEGRGLMNLQMQNADSAVRGAPSLQLPCARADAQIYHYSPATGQTTPVYTSRLLQRRLLSIHTAVASDVFGLVVHSVGLRSAQPLLAELRALLKQHRKKSYTLTVGRLNPAKLANFEAIECFVLVGCKEGGLVDSKVCPSGLSASARGANRIGLFATDHHTLGTALGPTGTRAFVGAREVDS